MEINYKLTEEDYLKFNLFHIKNSKTAIKALNMQRFLPPIFFIISAYIFTTVMNASFPVMLITFLIISILWIIFYPKYFYNYVIRNTKKMIREGKNDGLLGEHHLIMTEEGIEDSTTYGETRVSWSGLKNFEEDNYNFYLYNSSLSAYVIPKREVSNVEVMKNYLNSHIPRQK